MARTRNWSAATFAHVVLRHTEFGQNPAMIARATGLTYQQVRAFVLQITPTSIPTNSMVDPEVFDKVRTEIAAEIATNDEARKTTAAERRKGPTPEQQAALDEEVVGCIELVKAAASQFGITPRQFLHLCVTHARSAV